MPTLITPRLDATAKHPHVDGFISAHGAIFNMEPRPATWAFDKTQYFEPLKAVILRIKEIKQSMTLSGFEQEAGQKFREVTIFSNPPGKKYIKWYDARADQSMRLKSRNSLSADPMFAFWLIRAQPPSGTTLNPTVEIELASNSHTRWRIGLPKFGSTWKYPYLNKSKDGGLSFQTVSVFQEANTETRSAGDALEELLFFILLENEIFIYLSGVGEVWRYKESGLSIAAGPYRVLAQGHVIAFNLTAAEFETSGTVKTIVDNRGLMVPSWISGSQSFKSTATKPSGTNVVVSAATASGLTTWTATLTGTTSKTPILYRLQDVREPTFGAANASSTDLATLGKLAEAEWSESDDKHGGTARITIDDVPLATTPPAENSLVELTSGWAKDTGDDIAQDWWGFTSGHPIERKSEKPGYKMLIIEADAALRFRQFKCALIGNSNLKGWLWADAFKFGGRCAGFPNSRMTGVTDDGTNVNKDFIVDPDWDLIQFWNELVKMRGWEWGVNFAAGAVYARAIVTSGASQFTLDESTTTDGDFILDISSEGNLDERANLLLGRVEVSGQERMLYYRDANSVSSPAAANFLGSVFMRLIDLQGNDRPDKALYEMGKKAFAKTPRLLTWSTDGKRLHVGDVVTVQVTGIGVTAGTQMKILGKTSRVNAENNEYASEFTTEALT